MARNRPSSGGRPDSISFVGDIAIIVGDADPSRALSRISIELVEKGNHDAAAYACVSRSMVDHWMVAERRIPCIRPGLLVRGKILVPVEDFARFLADLRQEAG